MAREDLIRDATALVARGEIQLNGLLPLVTFGFRERGACSIYVGDDPAYHFNDAGELRRAFDQGLLIKAHQGRLQRVKRVRSAEVVALITSDFSEQDAGEFAARFSKLRDQLSSEIRQGNCRLLRQVPGDSDVLGRFRDWLRELKDPIPIARSAGLR